MWAAFGAVHLWLAYLGVVAVPFEAFNDVDLYRWWTYLALDQGTWPVLDGPWVYPAGAIVPMLLPGLGSTVSTPGYAVGWCVMVTLLDGVATAGLLAARAGGGRRRTAGAWWWLAFLLLLGPVAMGRLDAVVAPLMVLALLAAHRSPRLASALLTVGAWVKVAPGALLLPLLAAARRGVRDVVVPAAVVTTAVVAAVAAGGGLAHVASFVATQQDRGLQVEAVTATPWVLAGLARDDITIGLNPTLVTWEISGPGTATAAAVLDVVLLLALAAVAAGLLWARRRGAAEAVLLPGALVVVTVLVVVNKVGSPQFLTWLAAPIAVLLTARPRGPRWLFVAAVTGLVAADLTQVVFPWGYVDLLAQQAWVSVVLALRNVTLLVLLACGLVGLVEAARGGTVQPATGSTPSSSSRARTRRRISSRMGRTASMP